MNGTRMKPEKPKMKPEDARLVAGFFIGILFGIILQIVASWISPVLTVLLVVFSLVMLAFAAGRSGVRK